jgi:competence protein ComEA
MIKKVQSAGNTSRAVWIGTLVLGGGLVIASSAALASTAFQPGAQPQAAQSQAKGESQYPQLPEGPGKQTLIRVCSKCHSPTNVIANGQSRQGWEDTITKMAGLGAAGSDEDYTEILDYLIKSFPQVTSKINMNKATAADIEKQLGFSAKQAEDIVAYRQKNGNFKSLEDLQKVPQMNAMEITARKNRMTFE